MSSDLTQHGRNAGVRQGQSLLNERRQQQLNETATLERAVQEAAEKAEEHKREWINKMEQEFDNTFWAQLFGFFSQKGIYGNKMFQFNALATPSAMRNRVTRFFLQ